jgi:hypothetical protein
MAARSRGRYPAKAPSGKCKSVFPLMPERQVPGEIVVLPSADIRSQVSENAANVRSDSITHASLGTSRAHELLMPTVALDRVCAPSSAARL